MYYTNIIKRRPMDGRNDSVQGFHLLSTVVFSPKPLQILRLITANFHVSRMAGPVKGTVGHYSERDTEGFELGECFP